VAAHGRGVVRRVFRGGLRRQRQNGAEVQFTSEAWGDQFQAEFNGAVMITHYDFCSDNQGAELELDFGI